MKIPAQPKFKLNEIFVEGDVFGAIDSNLEAWLQNEWRESEAIEVEVVQLDEHKDNQELINGFGGEQAIINSTLQPAQIKYLVENEVLQTNGLSNLFFVYSDKEQKVFIVGVVFDKTIDRFVPYIYLTRNLYRAWTKGNRVFVKK